MHDELGSPKQMKSTDGFVVRPGQSRYDSYRPLHKMQPRPQLDPRRLKHRAESQLVVPAPPKPRPPASAVASVPAAASPLQHAVTAPKPRDASRRSRRRARKAERAPRQRHSFKHWLTHWNRRKVIKVSLLTLLCAILLAGGWLGWKVYHGLARATNNNNPLSLLGAFKPVPLKNTDGRVNVLLAGNSVDDPGHEGASLTDSIMVLSIDTRTKQASMLSIPRDLWVSIPGEGHQKINVAGTIDDFRASGYPSGGMGQLEQIITQNLGIPIHYYALVNYSAFRDLVSAVGGVKVNIQSEDSRGLYDPNIAKVDGGPLKLANGPQVLDGQTALNLARARGESYRAYGFPKSDFDRTNHQRQILLALKEKLTTTAVWTNPLKISQLADAVGKNVKTDFKLAELQTLYHYTKGVNDSNIASFNLNDLKKDATLLSNYTAPNGQAALIPAAGLDDFSQIKIALNRLFSSDPVVKEGATVVVLNGGGVTGLARKEADALIAKKLDVAAVSDAPQPYAATQIVDTSKGSMPGTKKVLQARYGNHFVASDPAVSDYTADFIVILGKDYAPPQSSTTNR